MPIRITLRNPPVLGDLLAGFSVALVLIPQAVAYAVLAGLPAERGIVVGIVSAVAAAPLLSSPYLQSGPTAVTSLLVLGTLTPLAEPQGGEFASLAALLALMVGVVRLAIALAGAGELAFLLSAPVLAGFTAAAAVVIMMSQLPVLTGVDATGPGVLAGVAQLVGDLRAWEPEPLLLGAATVVQVELCRRVHPLVPGVLLAIIAGLAYGHLVDGAATLGQLPTGLPLLELDLPWSRAGQLVLPALIIAVIGFSEAAAIAQAVPREPGGTDEAWDPDQEFASQGAANLAAGLLGGFPSGASFSRSALNRVAGARTSWSGLITGMVVLAAVPFTDLLRELPTAVLGGIIVSAVLRLADPRPVLVLRRQSRQQFVIATVTAALTVLLAPQVHWAIVTGVALSIGAHLRRERLISTDHWAEGQTLHIRPEGVLWFGSARRFEAQVEALLSEREWESLHVHLQRLGRTDVSGAYALRRLVEVAEQRGIVVTLTRPSPGSRLIVDRVVGVRPRPDG